MPLNADSLFQRVEAALEGIPTEPASTAELAHAVLASLGLDDLDAAVTRCAVGIVDQEVEDYGWRLSKTEFAHRVQLWRDNARTGLEAALKKS